MAKPTWYGDLSGVPLPQAEHQVAVEREHLTFDLRRSAQNPTVTAEYRIRHTGSEAVQLPVAFALYTPAGTDLSSVRVEVDSQSVPVRPVWLYELLWRRVEAWIEAHPELAPRASEVQRLYGAEQHEQAAELDQALQAEVAAAGLPAHDDYRAYELLRERLASGRAGEPGDPYDAMAIVRLVATEEAASAEAAWRAGARRETWPDPQSGGTYQEDFFDAGGMLALLFFDVDLPAGSSRDVTIRYRQQATRDGLRQVLHFEYLLQPGRHWAAFGPLDAEVLLPADWPLVSNLPMVRADRDGAIRYAVALPGLPDGDWIFSVQVPEGTVRTNSYPIWPFVLALLLGVLWLGALAAFLWWLARVLRRRAAGRSPAPPGPGRLR